MPLVVQKVLSTWIVFCRNIYMMRAIVAIHLRDAIGVNDEDFGRVEYINVLYCIYLQ